LRNGAIKGVIFDFGGVISDFDIGRFLEGLLRHTRGTEEEVRSTVYLSDLGFRYESGAIGSSEFFREIADVCSLDLCEEDFIPIFTDIFTPIESTCRLIKSLSGRYRLGLLSNTNEWHFEHHIRKTEVFPLFDAVTLSFRVKTMKPAEAIYRRALSDLGLAAGECAYIDDLEENVAGAERLGIRGIRYTGPEALLLSLRELGIDGP
jgi:FMN phosphatase YigB (HAD superfamily)